MDELVIKVNRNLLRIAKGNIKSLNDLYILTGRILFVMAKKYLCDANYAEDLLSDVYLKVVRKADFFKKGYNGLNWLIKIVKNEAINYNIKYGRRKTVELNENIHSAQDVEDSLSRLLVEEALQNLDEEEKHLIYLKYWEGYTVREIAQETGCAVTTTYDKIRNTLKKLKKLVK